MRRLNQILYLVLALLWAALGAGGLAALMPGEPSPEEIHLIRELGAGLVFVGFMHAWCAFRYERRLGVHFGLMLFAALFAGIHWYDWSNEMRDLASPLITSLPLVLLAVMLLGGRAAGTGATSRTAGF